MLHNKPIVIILAGGNSSRIGAVGMLLPKSLLPISDEDTVLSRLLSQLCEANFDKIIISTSPHYFELIQAFLRVAQPRIEERLNKGTMTIEVWKNPYHRYGPIPALTHILRLEPADRYLLCLSDIAYKKNPFSHLNKTPNPDAISLIVGPYRTERGGITVSKYGNLLDLQYRFNQISVEGFDLHNWSGAAEFGRSVALNLSDYSQSETDKPLEDAFNFLLKQGQQISICFGGEFVNVNTLGELLTFDVSLPNDISPFLT